MIAPFPLQEPGLNYLSEGGQETEIMYKFGHDLPEFALFTLLDDANAMTEVRGMYERYLDTAVRHGFGVIMGGLDYRASPDWGARLGIDDQRLADYQLRAIDFLRDVARPYADQLAATLVAGIVGPQGDAYLENATINEAAAEDYHGTQLATLAEAGVNLVQAMTFNNIPEAIGVTRAAANVGLPITILFTLDSTSRLKSGPSLREAIETVDAMTGDERPAYYGLNCSHPYEFLPALEPGDWFERVRCIRPNAAMADKISLCSLGHLEEGDPSELGRLMGELAARFPHLDIWGGCCGTWERHLDEIARNVRESRGLA